MIYEVSTSWNQHEIKLVKEKSVRYEGNLNHPSMIHEFCKTKLKLHKKSQEYVYALFFDTRYRLISYSMVSKGTMNYSLIDPKTIFSTALLTGAATMILVHNHPSGDVSPSGEDDRTTETILKAGEILSIPLADHLIVGGEKYFSYRENNMIN